MAIRMGSNEGGWGDPVADGAKGTTPVYHRVVPADSDSSPERWLDRPVERE